MKVVVGINSVSEQAVVSVDILNRVEVQFCKMRILEMDDGDDCTTI